ncbi:MAG: MobC family plasmid mobilization relaxosome protein [Clostridiales bacterium]|nr:MobC family plasmid mobilization relaxosome protein [Clostridiales bacterium]
MNVNRRRELQINFRVTPAERQMIKDRIMKSGYREEGEYLRRMAIDGYIFHLDNSDLKQLIYEINKIGTNINQIAHKINKDNEIYQTDMDELKEKMDRVWRLLRQSILQQP